MAGSKSNYLENAILNQVLGGVQWTPPAIVYVALSSAPYNEEAVGTNFNEIVGAGATRVAVANDTTNWPVTSDGSKRNQATITFPAATNTWLTVQSFYLLDAPSGGNILYGGDLQVPRTLEAGDTASFGPSSILIQED